jgi:hypothetical protein
MYTEGGGGVSNEELEEMMASGVTIEETIVLTNPDGEVVAQEFFVRHKASLDDDSAPIEPDIDTDLAMRSLDEIGSDNTKDYGLYDSKYKIHEEEGQAA